MTESADETAVAEQVRGPVGAGVPYRKCAAMYKVVGAIHESPERLPCVKVAKRPSGSEWN